MSAGEFAERSAPRLQWLRTVTAAEAGVALDPSTQRDDLADPERRASRLPPGEQVAVGVEQLATVDCA